jgi:hypothetical protein
MPGDFEELMYFAPLCSCGGVPVLNLVRKTVVSRKENGASIVENKFVLFKYRLKEDEELPLEEKDLLAAYCSVCGEIIDLIDTEENALVKIVANNS